jgi:hypothetical protein
MMSTNAIQSLERMLLIAATLLCLEAGEAWSGAGAEQSFRGRGKSSGGISAAAEATGTDPNPAPTASSVLLFDVIPSPNPTATNSPGVGQQTTVTTTSNLPEAQPSSESPAAESGGAGSAKKLEKTDDPCKQKDGMSKEASQQVGTYCAAADAAEEAAKNQKLLGGVHAGIAGICLIPCVNNMYMGMGEVTMGQVCSGASIAGAVTDVMLTKQYTGLMGAVVGAYGLINPGAKAAEKAAGTAAAKSFGSAAKNAKGGKSDKMSCITAAVETLQSVMSFQGAKNSEKTAEENRKNAAQLVDDSLAQSDGSAGSTSPAIAAAIASVAGGKTSTGSAQGLSGGVSTQDGTTLRPLIEPTKNCSGGFLSQLNCVAAKGVALPPPVRRSDFGPALEKLSGLPIDKLMSKGSTASIINAVAGQTLGESGKSQVAATVAQAEAHLQGDRGTMYASAGTGGGGSGGEGDSMSDIGKALGDLMEGANGKKAEEGPAGPKSENFAKNGLPGVSRAGIEEDRTISLFDRVSRRYVATRDRLATMKYSSAENRALSR